MVECKCGCGKDIRIKPYHKYYGVPEYIQGHQCRGKKKTQEHKNAMKIAFKNRKYKAKICLICLTEFIPNSSMEKWCKQCSKKRRKTYLNMKWRENMRLDIDAYRKKKRTLVKKRKQYLRTTILTKFNNKCIKCSNTDIRVLQIDHINGGGNKERKSFKNQLIPYYRHILKNINNYQLLCANCNWIKRYENEEYKTT